MPKTFRSGVDRDLITVKDGDDDINEIMMGLRSDAQFQDREFSPWIIRSSRSFAFMQGVALS
jgi:hypothetical protein